MEAIQHAANLSYNNNTRMRILNFGHGWEWRSNKLDDMDGLKAAIQNYTGPAGGLMIVTAGSRGNSEINNSWRHYPTSFGINNVISVNAATNIGTLMSNHNWGKETVHLLTGPVISGSFAPAEVSRVAAMIMNAHPHLSSSEVKAIILNSVDIKPELVWDTTLYNPDRTNLPFWLPRQPRGRITITAGILNEKRAREFAAGQFSGTPLTINYHLGIVGGQDPPQITYRNFLATLNQRGGVSGHDFVGWATSPNGGIVYENGATIWTGESDINLYARWTTGGSWKITLHRNYNGYDETVRILDTFRQVPTVLTNTFNRPLNRMFVGWATSPNGDVVIKDGETYTMCGSFSNGRSKPVPLKSIRTNDTTLGGKCAAKDKIHVWIISVFPEPDIP